MIKMGRTTGRTIHGLTGPRLAEYLSCKKLGQIAWMEGRCRSRAPRAVAVGAKRKGKTAKGAERTRDRQPVK